jgi:hypothetical protein
MTGNLVANISRRTLLLASCSLAGVPERSYAQARAMIHIILLGDSVFDNAAYVSRDPDVLRQLKQMLPQGRKATLLARDGAVISEIGNQLRCRRNSCWNWLEAISSGLKLSDHAARSMI